MKPPPIWSERQLEVASECAEEHFREGRHTEPLEVYLELFDDYRGVVEEVLEETVDLSRLRTKALDLVADRRKLEVLRYLSGPPVSADDLKVLLQAKSLAASRFRAEPELVDRLMSFVQDWHDRRRFPWLSESREPEEHDRNAAILATSALLAMRRVETMRRNDGKNLQERFVAMRLRRSGFRQMPTREVKTLNQAPKPGEFCRESMFGSRKADLIVGLPDGRTMALECKVSNSATNSIKRLNNDAAVKATTWRSDFGTVQVVTAAVLGGVYAMRNLLDAQERGLTLFWVHDLAAMIDWIRSTDPDVGLSTG